MRKKMPCRISSFTCMHTKWLYGFRHLYACTRTCTVNISVTDSGSSSLLHIRNVFLRHRVLLFAVHFDHPEFTLYLYELACNILYNTYRYVRETLKWQFCYCTRPFLCNGILVTSLRRRTKLQQIWLMFDSSDLEKRRQQYKYRIQPLSISIHTERCILWRCSCIFLHPFKGLMQLEYQGTTTINCISSAYLTDSFCSIRKVITQSTFYPPIMKQISMPTRKTAFSVTQGCIHVPSFAEINSHSILFYLVSSYRNSDCFL